MKPVQRGFVLPITVILLALVAVALVLMTQRADLLRQQVLRGQEEQHAERAISAAQAEALFLSSALHRRGSRLGEIELDGRFYLSSSGAWVQYRDAGALLSLKRPTAIEIQRLLGAIGLTDQTQIARLVDELLDYIDDDVFERLNGAEESAYRARGLPPPRNAALLSPMELRRLPSWSALPSDIWQRWLEQVHSGQQRTVNRHTITGPVLAALSGLEPSVAQDLVAQRLPGQMVRIESLPTIAGGSYLAESRYISVPSNTLLITLCHPRVQWCRQLAVTSLGESLHSPWRIDYALRLPRPPQLLTQGEPAALPDQLPDKPPPPLYNPLDTPPLQPS